MTKEDKNYILNVVGMEIKEVQLGKKYANYREGTDQYISDASALRALYTVQERLREQLLKMPTDKKENIEVDVTINKAQILQDLEEIRYSATQTKKALDRINRC